MTALPDTSGATPAARLCADEPVLIPLPPERDARVGNNGVGPCAESAARRGTVVEVRLSLPASARNGRA